MDPPIAIHPAYGRPRAHGDGGNTHRSQIATTAVAPARTGMVAHSFDATRRPGAMRYRHANTTSMLSDEIHENPPEKVVEPAGA